MSPEAAPELLPTLGIEVRTFPAGTSYAHGQQVAGISWIGSDVPLKVAIAAEAREIRNLDLTFWLNDGALPIRDIGFLDYPATMKAVPTGEIPGVGGSLVIGSGIMLHGTNKAGIPFSQIVEPGKRRTIAPVWRVTCDRLLRNSRVELVVAAVPFSPPQLNQVTSLTARGTFDLITFKGESRPESFDCTILIDEPML